MHLVLGRLEISDLTKATGLFNTVMETLSSIVYKSCYSEKYLNKTVSSRTNEKNHDIITPYQIVIILINA